MPIFLPQMRLPSIQVGDQPFIATPSPMARAPSIMRRDTAMMRPMVMSAVSSVRTPAVLVTVMPRASAVSTSMLSTPLPKLAISFRRGPACMITDLSMRVGHRRHQHVRLFHGLDQLGVAQRLVMGIEAGMEQLRHARFDGFRQLARDDDGGFGSGHPESRKQQS